MYCAKYKADRNDSFEKVNKMALLKIYDLQSTQEAVDFADNANINKYRLVRNDVTNTQFTQKNIKQRFRNQEIDEDLRYPGAKDVGHTFRHVKGTHAAGKSTYFNKATAIKVTCLLLNSVDGQNKLAELQAELATRALYDNASKRITATIDGAYFGYESGSRFSKKIIEARCEILSLGENLWIHSSYPIRFLNT